MLSIEFIRQHSFFPDMNFNNYDDPNLHGHLIKCARRLRKSQSCVVGLVYEAVQRGLPEADGCRTGREYFNKLGLSQSLYDAGMFIGKHIRGLELIKYYFMNGQIEWTKLRTVCRFIKKSNQEWWLQQLAELTRSELEKLLMSMGHKKPTRLKKDTELGTLRILNSMKKKFKREFEVASKADSSIKSQTIFLERLLSCWKEASSHSRQRPKSAPKSDIEEERLSTLLSNAFEASMLQLKRGLKRAKGDWAKIQIPREIPRPVKEYVRAATANLCAASGCTCKIDVFHHLDRYGLFPFHFPRSIAGLCKAHSGLIDCGKVSQESLGLPSPFDPKGAKNIDEMCRSKRLEAKRKRPLEKDDWTENDMRAS